MDHLYQKVSYLKGLAEGLGIEESTKEGKLLLHMVDTLEDFAEAIEELDEYMRYVDEDLADVEEEVYGLIDEDYEYDDFEDEYNCIEIKCPDCDEEDIESLDKME